MEFGLGHVIRCTSFYDALIQKNHNVTFVIHGDNSVKKILKERNHKIRKWHNNICHLKKYLKRNDGVILDSTMIKQEEISILCNCNIKLLVIDDYKRYKYENAIVLDWTVNAEKSGVHEHNLRDNTLLLGLEYLVLRPEFYDYQVKLKTFEKIFISLGGSDIRSLIIPIVENLRKCFPEICITVVTSAACFNEQRILNLNDANTKIYSCVDSKKLCKLIIDCDVAISAGGQSLYELATLNIPVVAIEVIENQREDIAGWYQAGLVTKVIKWNDRRIHDKIKTEILKLKPISIRKKIQKRNKNKNISKTVHEIINKLVSKIKN